MARDIREWLEGLELGEYADVFVENGVDLRALPHLSEDDLKELGVLLGHRRIMRAAISSLRDQRPPGEAAAPEATTRAEAERRQLTVLFCDLVGSTELSGHLDPEDLRELLRRYQDAVAGVVSRHEGYVANYLGDGVLAYFGWPRAHEDQAAQAARAGLAAIQAVAAITAPESEPLAARVGIASGQVVVGDLHGESGRQAGAVSGETPNLAARLQALGGPGEVVIDSQTQQLVGRQFDLIELGPQTLKGIAGPVPAWRVTGESPFESRFQARTAALVGFVGREHELGLLLERWRLARQGEGQVVLLSGEAGIGKSRLTEELRQRIDPEDAVALRYQCVPQYANSAFWPVTRQLQRAAGFATDDSPSSQLDKLEALVGGDREVVKLLAGLLSVPFEDRYGPQDLTPEARKQDTIRALVDQLLAPAENRPVLFLFEDTQWIDPSSEELLVEIVARVAAAPALMVVTCRPVWQAPWAGQPHVTMLNLNRLGRAQATAIATAVAGPQVDTEVIARIVARTDGIPLFVEELTKALVEGGLDADGDDIPATLQASLAARLDRLDSAAKGIAQVGAVIGREFDHDLLTVVADIAPQRLAAVIDQLVTAGLLFRTSATANPHYSFKHALVQDTAYGSLLRANREVLHQRVAIALQESYPQRIESEPEILGHHYLEGGQIAKSVPYWILAGKHEAERSSDREAIQHLRCALQLLEQLPDGIQRRSHELEIHIALGPVLMNVTGSASADVGASYLRARELCDEVGRPEQRFPVLWGLWLHHFIGGDAKAALAVTREAIELAETLRDEDFLLQAHHAAWSSQAGLGNFSAVVEHAHLGLQLYDAQRHRYHAFTYGGHDPGVCAASHYAIGNWFLGFPNRSLESSEQALRLAHARSHPFSSAEALAYAALLRLLRREPESAGRLADELVGFCDTNDLKLWSANGQILRSISRVELGDGDPAIREFRSAMKTRELSGSRLRDSIYLAAMADAMRRTGRLIEAESVIGSALAQLQTTGERTWETIVHWVRGEIIRLVEGDGSIKAWPIFCLARDIARRQGALSMELRTTISLARLYAEAGKKDEACALLAPVYTRFTEGFDTPDLVEAKALLDQVH